MPSPRPSGRRPCRGWEPAWFRLEGREERARGPAAPRGSHPRLDIQDRTPGAAARPAHGALPGGACPRRGPLPDRRPPSSPARGLPARTHPCLSEPGAGPCTQFLRQPTFLVAGANAPTVPHSVSRPCPAHILTPTRSGQHPLPLQGSGHRRDGPHSLVWARPRLDAVPPLTSPCSSGPSEQRALDLAGRASESAAEVTGEGKPRAPTGRRPGTARAARRCRASLGIGAEPRPRLQGARFGRASGGNCSEARTLPAAPLDPRELKRKARACSSLGSSAGSPRISVSPRVKPPQLSRPPSPVSDSQRPLFPLTSISLSVYHPTGLSSPQHTDPQSMPKTHSLTRAQSAGARTGLPTHTKCPRVLCQQAPQTSPLVLSGGGSPPSTGVPNLSSQPRFRLRLCPENQIEGNRRGKFLPWRDLSLF